jgi:hypothetical protein
LTKAFLDVLSHYTAGDPMDAGVRWTHLHPREICQLMLEKHAVKTSNTVVKKLLNQYRFRRRKAQKKVTMGSNVHRDAQFKKISRLRDQYTAAGNPVVSIDTKKKELIGNFYREGHLYAQEIVAVNDHDFPSDADGVVIPHAIYDLRLNHGYVHLGTSKDTTEFACESILHWWQTAGVKQYPDATSILILCDGGGSNSSRYYIFKQDLQLLANKIGIEIRVAHYPPYCSKYNPIEHRLFPHITRACQGVVFKSMQIVKELMARTKTSTGLAVTVAIFNKVYETGRKVSDIFRENMPIVFDDDLPEWNYRALPQTEIVTVI